MLEKSFALLAYALFNLSSLWLAGFLINWLAPTGVDRALWTLPGGMLWNLLGALAFVGHHSLMARASVKQWRARWIAPRVERSVYVLEASLLLMLMMLVWQPDARVIWDFSGQTAVSAGLYALFGFGWVLVLWSTFQIDHCSLFGLRQAFTSVSSTEEAEPGFRIPFLYRFCRHPMMVGVFIALWATPTMTVGHLLLAVAITVYIMIGTRYEERDMLRMFGDQYRDYQNRVPRLVPRLTPLPKS